MALSTESRGNGTRRWKRRAVVGIVACCVLGSLVWGVTRLTGGSDAFDIGSSPTFTARRGDLKLSVLEGGSVEALESQEIRSEVKGHEGTKILTIVEEGYRVTEEDVANKKQLVELDSSALDERLKNQQIQIEGTSASLIEAQKSYEIQLNQNESDIQTVSLEAKFARMDLEKYLGAELGLRILDETKVLEHLREDEEKERVSASASHTMSTQQAAPAVGAAPPTEQVVMAAVATAGAATPAPESDTAASETPAASTPEATPAVATTTPDAPPPPPAPAPETSAAPAETPSPTPAEALRVDMDSKVTTAESGVDFSKYAEVNLLGDGEARQKLRELEDKLLVAREELSLAETELEGTERLVAKQFEKQQKLDNDRLTVEKSRISVAAAETAQSLFERYEFPKEAEKLLSDYVEKLRKLQRTLKESESKLAQAEAKLRSAEARFEIESQQLKELKEQLEKCKIHAERPGLVVYGGGNDRWYGEERIQEGATVRERQMIITIPDMTKMSVTVKIHESDIKKVAVGQKATIKVDAFPELSLDGEVIKVGVLPDAEQRWMNPDLKLYESSFRLDSL